MPNWPPQNQNQSSPSNAASKFGGGGSGSPFGPSVGSSSSSPAANKFGPSVSSSSPMKPAAGATTTTTPAAPAAASSPSAALPAASPAASPAAAASPSPAATASPSPAAASPTAATDQQKPSAAPEGSAEAAAAAAPAAAAAAVAAAGSPAADGLQQQQQDGTENAPHGDGEGDQQDGHPESQPEAAAAAAEPEPEPVPEPEDPDKHLQPGHRRLLEIVKDFDPKFACYLAGDFKVDWRRGAATCPPFDPLAQPAVKKVLSHPGDSKVPLRGFCITAAHSIAVVGANSTLTRSILMDEMRKIQLVRQTPKSPTVVIVDCMDKDGARSTSFFVLLTQHKDADFTELKVKNELKGVPVEVTSKPPVVRMPDLNPLLRRMRLRTEEHDQLMQERAAVLERIRRLQLQSIARSAVEKLSLDVGEEAATQERTRQNMLNILINYICGSEPRSRGEYY